MPLVPLMPLMPLMPETTRADGDHPSARVVFIW